MLATFPTPILDIAPLFQTKYVSKEQFKQSLEAKVKQGPSNPQRQRVLCWALTQRLKCAILEAQPAARGGYSRGGMRMTWFSVALSQVNTQMKRAEISITNFFRIWILSYCTSPPPSLPKLMQNKMTWILSQWRLRVCFLWAGLIRNLPKITPLSKNPWSSRFLI